MPTWVCASPFVAMVRRPVRNVVSSSGNGGGSHLSWPIGGSDSRLGALRMKWRSTSVNLQAWRTDGLIRYSQVLRLRAFGTVKAVPESCSVYRPSGGRCGLFWPTGSAPGTASDANSFPKPDWYSTAMGRLHARTLPGGEFRLARCADQPAANFSIAARMSDSASAAIGAMSSSPVT